MLEAVLVLFLICFLPFVGVLFLAGFIYEASRQAKGKK